jgi:ELWxxDGT repeat protein
MAKRTRARKGTIQTEQLEARVMLSRVELVYEPDTTTASAFPDTGYRIVASGQNAYFTAATKYGRELWTSDGTAAGTHLVKDIIPGSAGITNDVIVPFGSVALFNANVKSGTTATETWRTDGTEAGTYPLTYSTTNAWDFIVTAGTARVGNALYGEVRNRDSGLYALGVTDGTTAGTQAVSDNFTQNLSGFCVVDGAIYFTGSDAAAGQELWRSDGTAAGTVRVADIRPGTSGSSPSNLVAANHQLFFQADDGTTGREWWVTSPGGTTHEIANLATGAASVSVNGTAAIAGATPDANGILLFYTSNIGSAGKTIWRSDGTQVGTFAIKPMSGTVFTITPAGKQAYFSQGGTLWKSDGTVAGTVIVQDATGYVPVVADYGLLASKVVFRGTTLNQGSELWISDGTPAGTALVKDIAPGAASANPWMFGSNPEGGRLFFAADANDGKGLELWASDGTTGGTAAVADVNTLTPSSKPWGLTKVGSGQAFYYVQQSGVNHGLWKTDGTSAGTSRIGDAYVEADPAKTQQVAAVGDHFFFSGQTISGGSGFEPFVSDGTAAGTHMIADLQSGTAGSSPRDMTVVGDHLYFIAGSDYALYRTDATGSTVEKLATGIPDNVNTMAVVGDYLYYSNGSTVSAGDLWRVKAGSPVEHVATLDIIEGVYNIHDRLIVQTRTLDTSVASLYESDGTAAGTRQIAYLGQPHTLIGVLQATPFGAVFGAGPYVYATDLTTEGTRRIFTGKFVKGVRVYHGQTYLQLSGAGNLQASDGLYITDGTEAGTKQLKSGYFYLENHEVIDGRMYFEGYGFTEGAMGLWESDGTADGTRQVTPIAPGPIEGTPQPMVDLNRTILMVADDHGDHGQEIWRVNPDMIAPMASVPEFQPGDGGSPVVRVHFSERVASSLTGGSLQLINVTTGQVVPASAARVDYDSATDTASFTFAGGLSDGNYHLTVPVAGATDASGNALASAASLDFYVLDGDANRDRKVDFLDLAALAQNYNGGGGKTWADGDFNGDGAVDFLDLAMMAQRYNTSLAAPGAAVTAAPVSASTFAADWAALTTAPVAATPVHTDTKKVKSKPVFSIQPVVKPAPSLKKELKPRRK